ncbi:MAG: Lrp/AsnC family transcriptional regulator [Thermoplasmata archaeon]|nr:MAG: Lrp/AsnC family transcriptional regulator [Thermoplasmata archaeon]KAA0009624.1 MAG: Lrp/AsnC family transcriptional regulator [Thermoplasmata archaeon]MCD6542541.1 Lrp/AsnC ligand binding domain-containing protein [Thermoplasmata archaeon]
MIKAYILVRTRIGKLEEILKKAKEIENVENISVVSGDYDMIIKVRVDNLEDLMKLTDKLHLIDGIKQTVTYVIEKEISL